MTPVERSLLPADTVLRKNHYEREDDRLAVQFTIVMSGRKRSSIHRPEVCLVGPGSEIARSFVHRVKLSGGHVLKVKILEMLHRTTRADGTTGVVPSYYAYWFAGLGRETPSHLQRMMWMASDRLFRGRNYRWAYISVAGLRHPGNTDYLNNVDAFLRDAYPLLHQPEMKTQPSTSDFQHPTLK
jgi:hypothetical protein